MNKSLRLSKIIPDLWMVLKYGGYEQCGICNCRVEYHTYFWWAYETNTDFGVCLCNACAVDKKQAKKHVEFFHGLYKL